MSEVLESLLSAVASGDENAFGALAEEYAPLIRSMSARFASSFSEGADAIGVQDLEQEARLALYRAATTYDPGKNGVTFGLYAKICIRNALVSLWRKSVSAARAVRKEEAAAAVTGHDPLSALLSASEADALHGRIRRVLSPYESRIFELYIHGTSVKGISETVGKPEKSVSNALYRIRIKIKGLLSN